MLDTVSNELNKKSNQATALRYTRRGAGAAARFGAREAAEALFNGAGGAVASGINTLVGARSAYSSRQHANALSTQHQAIYGYPAEAYEGEAITSVKVAVAYAVMKKNRKVNHRGVDATFRAGGAVAGAVVGNVPGMILGSGVARGPTFIYKTLKYAWKSAKGTRGVHRGQAADVLWQKTIEGHTIPHELKDDDHHMALFACEEILGDTDFDLAMRGYCDGDKSLGATLLKQKLKSW